MEEAADSQLSGRAHSHTAPNSARSSYIVNGRPLLLQRTSSLAELAREHKRQRGAQNDTRKFFLDGDDGDEEPPLSLEQAAEAFPRWKQPAPEHSNLLYRTGSRLALHAGLEIGEGYDKVEHSHTRRTRSQPPSVGPSRHGSVAPSPSNSSTSSDSESNDRVLHIGRATRSDTVSSEVSLAEPKWPWRVPHMGLVASVLGFSPCEPVSAADKVYLREKSTGFDPALVLAIAVGILT